jgi:drug/metabolite transporter (DMT)-like permease
MTVSSFTAGHLLAFGATLIWSSLYIFAKILADSFSPVELSFWRWVVAVAVFLPFVRQDVWAERRIIRDHAVRLTIISLIGMVGFSVLIFQAGKTTTATNMSLLAATAPVFIALVCRFALHERLSGQQVTGLCIAVAGVVVLVTRGDVAHLLNLNLAGGDLWSLCAAMCFGLYSVLVRFRPPQIGPNVFLCVIMGMGAILMLPPTLWQWLCVKPLFRPTGAETIALLYLGIATSVVGFLLWNKAVMLIGAVRAGVVYYSLPFFSYVLALVFLGERLALPQAVGGALIIGGIVFSSLGAAAKR